MAAGKWPTLLPDLLRLALRPELTSRSSPPPVLGLPSLPLHSGPVLDLLGNLLEEEEGTFLNTRERYSSPSYSA